MEIAKMEIAMKTQTTIALAAAALLAGVSAASAAPAPPKSTAPASPMHSSNLAPAPKETIRLSSTQQKMAWKDLSTGALNQKTPAGFNATIGATMPARVATANVTAKAATDVPTLKQYNFAMVQKKLVIVSPTDRKIVDVITR
ncbi:MAG: hypothetical protein KGQ47_15750 [Hyphomicrobiales bacterium]|nr:hypothetical protein [Hyphomicrobiales bacterium]